jgi:hypothetical protein
MTSDMFFDSWAGLGRVLIVGTLAYAALVILLRTTGSSCGGGPRDRRDNKRHEERVH